MTWDEFKQRAMPLAVQLGAEWDLPTWKMYHRAAQSMPMGLFEVALQRVAETRTKFPSVAQLRELAEQHRRALLAAHPYEGCAECEGQRGFRTVISETGQKTVERCPCKARHAEKLERLGAGSPVAEIASEANGDSEQVYPTMQQLPEPVRQRLGAIAGQKALR
jgi:hypothetical protein